MKVDPDVSESEYSYYSESESDEDLICLYLSSLTIRSLLFLSACGYSFAVSMFGLNVHFRVFCHGRA